MKTKLERTDLKAVVGPRAKLHRAALIIEREVSNVNLARAAQLGRRWPEHVAVMSHHCVALHKPASEVVRTATVFANRLRV